ncbi:MAG: hypothetical protein J6W54_12590 [Fibrobacter sp.]|uniref:hypothetical protein n=1 Tax=Fibrobacter sp. TaxID=35828 RepID=UPI001B203016|nr:hypothetical protein [Fibrobacter sp.]MBO7061912.1 hypothetical protein [Fibrobacter sp.]
MTFYLKNLFLFGLLILVLSSCFSHKWEQKTWTEELFDNVKEANESEYLFRNEKQKLITYAFCEEKDDDMIFRHPCDLDSAYISRIKEKVYSYDSTTGLKISLQSLYYAAYAYDRKSLWYNNGLADKPITAPFIFRITPRNSGIRVKKDGSMESYCASADSVKCSYLFAEIQVSKKMTDSIHLMQLYDVFLDTIFKSTFSRKMLIDYIADARGWGKLDSGYIPYELCWQDGGRSIPCNLETEMNALIDKHVSSIKGGKLLMVSFGPYWMNDIISDAVLSKHVCRSDDGVKCKEGFFWIENEKHYIESYRIDLQKGSIEKEDYPPLGKFVDSWTYYDENDKYVKVYDETGQNERYLEYYRVENAPLPIHSKYYSPY